MGQGKDVRVPNPSRIDEIVQLHEALRGAAAAVRERSDLQEREKAALQASDRAKDEFLAMLEPRAAQPARRAHRRGARGQAGAARQRVGDQGARR